MRPRACKASGDCGDQAAADEDEEEEEKEKAEAEAAMEGLANRKAYLGASLDFWKPVMSRVLPGLQK
jgi:hypothetical protein